jgi:hypothetical protein
LGGSFVFRANYKKREATKMWNIPTLERLNKIPKLNATEHVPLEEKEIHLHFFLGECDWYIAEYDGKDLFFGFCILNGDLEMAEWGYISFGELVRLKISDWLEVDSEIEEHFPVTKAKDIEKIREAHKWPKTDERNQGKEEKSQPSFPYTEEELEEILGAASFDSVIELKCPVCGCSIRCEPDAETGYCASCCKVVNTNNPLMALGLFSRKQGGAS